MIITSPPIQSHRTRGSTITPMAAGDLPAAGRASQRHVNVLDRSGAHGWARHGIVGKRELFNSRVVGMAVQVHRGYQRATPGALTVRTPRKISVWPSKLTGLPTVIVS